MSRRRPFEIEGLSADSDIFLGVEGSALDFEESMMDRDSWERLERNREGTAYPRFVTLLACGVMILLVGRLYHLTVKRFEEMRAVAEGNRLRIEYLAAPRGTTFDKNRQILAANRPSFELVAIPLDLPKDQREKETVVNKAAEILAIDPKEIIEIISKVEEQSFQSALIKQNIPRDQALIFQERQIELPGFRVVNAPIRDYAKNPLAYSHLLGYVGKINTDEYAEQADAGYQFNDSIGKTGLELVYENDLRGTFGERQVEVDSRGVVKKIYGEKNAVPGDDIVLNIDAGLQDELYELLAKQLQALNRRKAAAIAMDPRDGRILAYLSLPGFDNNVFAEGIEQQDYSRLLEDKDQPLFNRTIAGIYPPGSTVKPMISIAALEAGVITQETIIKDEGEIVIPNIYGGPDSVFIGYGRKALGMLTVRKAIALSSDIFFYVVGGGFGPARIDGLGIERLAHYYRMFKLDQKLGIDLNGEREGLVPDQEWKKDYFGSEVSGKWYLGDTYHVSIGQGDLLVSPLHVLSWTATIANGGTVYKPLVVDRVEKDGQIIEKNEPEVIGKIDASSQNIRVVQEGMREAVFSGTATSLKRLPISSAAKTGTA